MGEAQARTFVSGYRVIDRYDVRARNVAVGLPVAGYGWGRGPPFRLPVFLQALKRGVWALGARVIILGGIYTAGSSRRPRGAAVACVYAALETRHLYREIA
jgi:TRAP-type C4-dicarboxylate transport system permease large subunit